MENTNQTNSKMELSDHMVTAFDVDLSRYVIELTIDAGSKWAIYVLQLQVHSK